jgi:hypothetical protein
VVDAVVAAVVGVAAVVATTGGDVLVVQLSFTVSEARAIRPYQSSLLVLPHRVWLEAIALSPQQSQREAMEIGPHASQSGATAISPQHI